MIYNERLTRVRVGGLESGYWTPHKKDELLQRLAQYEDTGLSPEEVEALSETNTVGKKLREITAIMGNDELDKLASDLAGRADISGLRSYISRRESLLDELMKLEDGTVFTVSQLKQIFDLAK